MCKIDGDFVPRDVPGRDGTVSKNTISNLGQRVMIVLSAQANCLSLYSRMNLETPQLLLLCCLVLL